MAFSPKQDAKNTMVGFNLQYKIDITNIDLYSCFCFCFFFVCQTNKERYENDQMMKCDVKVKTCKDNCAGSAGCYDEKTNKHYL